MMNNEALNNPLTVDESGISATGEPTNSDDSAVEIIHLYSSPQLEKKDKVIVDTIITK